MEVAKIPAEKTYENKIKRYLKSRGAWFVKFFANAYTPRGIPDILALVNGYFVGVEVKAANGEPSEMQLYHVKKIRDAGGFAFVLYPSKFDEFKKFVDGLTRDEFDRDTIPIIWR